MASLEQQKIFTYDPLHAREISESYLGPSTEQGQLFIVLELPQNHKVNQITTVDELIDKTANYFSILKAENTETLLEDILRKINQFLPDLAAEIKIRNWLAGLAMAIGIIHEDQVYLSTVGNLNAFIVHHHQLTPLADRSQAVNPHKVFADIISGQLEEGDGLIISTDSLFDYISREKIRQIVKQYTAEAAGRKIQALLEGVPDFVTFNALIIKNPGLTDQDLPISKARPELVDEEDLAHPPDAILKPERTVRAKPHTRLILDPGALKNISSFKKFLNFLKMLGNFFWIVGLVLKKMFRWLANVLLFVFSRGYRRQQETRTLTEIQDLGQEKYHWWQSLSRAKKISLILMLALLLIFLQSLVFLTQEREVEKKDQAYDQLLTQFNQKMGEAETKLIYQDEPAAEQILDELLQQIKNTKPNSESQADQLRVLQERVSRELNKVRKIHEVPAPLEVADLSGLLAEPARQIVQKNGAFYILGQDTLYLWSQDHLSPLTAVNNGLWLSDWPNENRLIIASDQKFFIYHTDSRQLSDLSISINAGNSHVRDIGVYGDNLYVLDSSANKIFKYPQNAESFGTGSRWLQENYDLSQTGSIAIDGNIYSIDAKGQITKFLKGRVEKFDYHQPRPPLGAGAIINTFRNSPYLYLLDPSTQRIIILDKEGNIKDQFTSAKFDQLTDLAVDPAEKAIYLLNNNRIYLLPVNQE